MLISEMLDYVNAHYQRCGAATSARLVSESSPDVSVGRTCRRHRLHAGISRARLVGQNSLERIRSRYKARPASTTVVTTRVVSFDGEVYANHRNDTLVLLQPDRVEKFFFRELSYFAALYGTLSLYEPIAVTVGDAFVAVRQPRYLPWHASPLDMLAGSLSVLVERQTGMAAWANSVGWLTVECKIRHLLNAYGISATGNIEQYLRLAAQFDLLCRTSSPVVCHGDLWRANILCRPDGGVALIDFDKAVLFLPCYDPVYFLLMEILPSAVILSDSAVSQLDQLVSRLRSFAGARLASLVPGASDADLKLCALLFLFLKQAERDARHDTLGLAAASVSPVLSALAGA